MSGAGIKVGIALLAVTSVVFLVLYILEIMKEKTAPDNTVSPATPPDVLNFQLQDSGSIVDSGLINFGMWVLYNPDQTAGLVMGQVGSFCDSKDPYTTIRPMHGYFFSVDTTSDPMKLTLSNQFQGTLPSGSTDKVEITAGVASQFRNAEIGDWIMLHFIQPDQKETKRAGMLKFDTSVDRWNLVSNVDVDVTEFFDIVAARSLGTTEQSLFRGANSLIKDNKIIGLIQEYDTSANQWVDSNFKLHPLTTTDNLRILSLKFELETSNFVLIYDKDGAGDIWISVYQSSTVVVASWGKQLDQPLDLVLQSQKNAYESIYRLISYQGTACALQMQHWSDMKEPIAQFVVLLEFTIVGGDVDSSFVNIITSVSTGMSNISGTACMLPDMSLLATGVITGDTEVINQVYRTGSVPTPFIVEDQNEPKQIENTIAKVCQTRFVGPVLSSISLSSDDALLFLTNLNRLELYAN